MTPRRTIADAPDGLHISYVVAGDGPTVLIVPGLLQRAQDWIDAGYVDELAVDHRVIVMDPLGHGESDISKDPADYGTEPAVAQTVAVLEAEGVDRAICWGYTTGAETVLSLARRRSDLVRAAVVGELYLGDFAVGMLEAGRQLDEVTRQAAESLDRGDWEGYFDLLTVETPAPVREHYAAVNDPVAIAANVRGDLHRARGFLKPPVPTFAYWATDVIYAEVNTRRAEGMAISWKAIPGDRPRVFAAAGAVCAEVRAFEAVAIS